MNTKFAVGCVVQWYECDMIEDYVQSLINAIDYTDNKNIVVDFTLITNQDLEQIDEEKISMSELESKFEKLIDKFDVDINFRKTDNLYTIADYRRWFNDYYCEKVDVLVWGESDSLLPRQMFTILDNLHNTSVSNGSPKYLAFFGTCKMWDDSWKPVEHTKFTDKEVDNKAWWGTRYVTSIEEMDKINSEVDDLDVRLVSPHKFNGCGLIMSSEVVKSGVNIPKSVFFTNEDTAFMMMTNKVLGNIPQYIIKNILLVDNREHHNKRMYIEGEVGETLGERRNSNNWYKVANEMSKQNCHNIFNNNYKSFTWGDVWKNIK